MEKSSLNVQSERNYQVDALKLLCALLVVLCHCNMIAETSELQEKLVNFGWVSVHVFFVISGFFMIKSLNRNMQKSTGNTPGADALSYVIGRYKKIALPFLIAALMSLSTYLIINIYIYI